MDILLVNEGLVHIGRQIFEYLDFKSLLQCYSVCQLWRNFIDYQFDEEFKPTELVLRLHHLKTRKKAYISRLDLVQDLHCILEGFPSWYKVFEYFESQANFKEQFMPFLQFMEIYFDDPNVPYDYSPLHYASMHGNLLVLQLLFQSPINQNEPNESSETPLHIASYHGRSDVVNYFLGLQLDFNASTKYGDTPLHYAVEQGQTLVVEILLSNAVTKGIDVNAQAVDGNTPLQLACMLGKEDIVMLLFAYYRKHEMYFDTSELPFKNEILQLFIQ